MSGNTFGKVFRLTTFGESHGAAIGGVLDGCPAGLPITVEEVQAELDKRKPGQGPASTTRKESDSVRLLSGRWEGKTTGAPIAFYIANEDAHSKDYGPIADIFRPGHADYSYFRKYRGIRDYRGGGRSSGRETAIRVAGGAIAKKLLSVCCQASVYAACVELAGIAIRDEELDLAGAVQRAYFAANEQIIPLWDKAIKEAIASKDSVGGIIRIEAHNIPAGLGEPVFDKLDATLAHAIMSVGAIKGVEIGAGFAAARSSGSENNDPMLPGTDPAFESNNAGGILGGISTGQPIVIQAAVKPIASIAREQQTVDVKGQPRTINIGGRHDVSAIPRVAPVLSAMTALALADAFLLQARMNVIQ